uniref:Uncharacterized protein n=1 Tax=Salix viminalis TaxID=40686 RepID=A0A6N2LQ49_SALVM
MNNVYGTNGNTDANHGDLRMEMIPHDTLFRLRPQFSLLERLSGGSLPVINQHVVQDIDLLAQHHSQSDLRQQLFTASR